eukprot:762973-Rhodomonas_salina.3
MPATARATCVEGSPTPADGRKSNFFIKKVTWASESCRNHDTALPPSTSFNARVWSVSRSTFSTVGDHMDPPSGSRKPRTLPPATASTTPTPRSSPRSRSLSISSKASCEGAVSRAELLTRSRDWLPSATRRKASQLLKSVADSVTWRAETATDEGTCDENNKVFTVLSSADALLLQTHRRQRCDSPWLPAIAMNCTVSKPLNTGNRFSNCGTKATN